MRAPQLRAGSRVAKRLFVAAVLALSVVGTPNAGAQTLENQAEVDQALKELADATKGAQDTIPGNSRIKDAEDTFDAAVRKNEDTPADPKQAKDQAQNAQDNAKARADGLRTEMADRTSAEQAERAKQYRDALQKRRAARKKLQEVEQRARKLATNAQNQGLQDVLHLYQGQISRIRTALNGSQVPVARPKQTASLQPARTFVQTAQTMPAAGQQTARTEYLQWYVDMTAGAVNRDSNATQFRLAQQVGGLNVPISGVKQNDVGATGQIRLSIPLVDTPFGPVPQLSTPPRPRYAIDISYAFMQVEGGSSGAGPQTPVLALPGLGVQGSNPFSVPAGYLCFGQPYSLAYDYLLRRHLFAVHAQLLVYNVTQHLLLQPLVGTRFAHTSVDDNFGYSVPVVGDPVTGNYQTKTDVISGGAVAGFKIWSPFHPLSSPAVRYILWMSAVAGFDFNRATSDVTFNMRTNTFADTQKVSISDSKITHYVRVDAGADVDVGHGFKFVLGLYLASGGYAPIVQVPGLNLRPTLSGENEWTVGGNAGVRVTF